MTREDAIKAMADAIEKLVLKNDTDGKSLTSYPDTATAALSSLESLGLAIVPIDADAKMLRRGASAYDYPSAYMGGPSTQGERTSARIWKSMLSASPLRKTDGEGK